MVGPPDSLGCIFPVGCRGKESDSSFSSPANRSGVSLLPLRAFRGRHQYAPAVSHYLLFFCQKQMNLLSISSKTWGKWLHEPWVIGMPRVSGGVVMLQNSFSRTLTSRTILGDLSITLQHALQKN